MERRFAFIATSLFLCLGIAVILSANATEQQQPAKEEEQKVSSTITDDAIGKVEKSEPPQLLYPANYCVLPRPQFQLIASHAADASSSFALKIDDTHHHWQKYAPPAYVADVALSTGKHLVEIDGAFLEIFVDGPNQTAPDDWSLLHQHPKLIEKNDNCAVCHQVTQENDLTQVQPFSDTLRCLACHTEDTFEKKHQHALAPLRDCHYCHAVHGATRNVLLKAPKEKLCADCHDLE